MKNDKTSVTIRVDNDLLDKIEKDAEESERDRTKQIVYMLKKYYEIINTFNK